MSKFSDSHWLTPWEQEEVIGELVKSPAGLIKWDNGRNLPIKSGGKTDIYINLRNARNDPAAIRFLSEAYANPIRRLKVRRFGEVPDSVTCFAGPLSLETNLPFVTLREKPKEGRVAKASVIGDLVRGEKFAFFDDVITNGKSKIAPARECLAAGVDLGPLVVLVDREQG
jgi:orotate phosphoribosyltransferase